MKYQVLHRRGKVIIAGERVHYVGGNLARAWEEALSALGLEAHRWEHVLLVGMGASLIDLLARGKHPPHAITVIEIDPEMVRLQERLFTLPVPYQVLIGDAADLLPTLSDTYEGIFVDAFVEDEVPPTLLCDSFVNALKLRLSPQGILIWNVLRPTQAEAVGALLSKAFPAIRRWRYAPHTFWIAAHSRHSFHTPF